MACGLLNKYIVSAPEFMFGLLITQHNLKVLYFEPSNIIINVVFVK